VSESVFVDTSAWFALADRRDANHDAASEIVRRLLERRALLVTTNQVAAETYTLMRNRLGPQHAQSFLVRVRISPSTQRVLVLEGWEEAAEDLLREYMDQDFSYVDATSFVSMRRLGLQDAFAFDSHFSIAGFALMTADYES
jgi:predicted nucleic acid-binding protein